MPTARRIGFADATELTTAKAATAPKHALATVPAKKAAARRHVSWPCEHAREIQTAECTDTQIMAPVVAATRDILSK